MLNQNGAMYFAFGAWHCIEAIRSARSLKFHNPDLPIFFVTQPELVSNALDVFDYVFLTERKDSFHIFTERVRFLSLTPFARTLFVDSDTLVNGDLTAAFDSLDDHDFAICEHPDSKLLNCGVFAYRSVGRGAALIEHWRSLLESRDQSNICDQTIFNNEIVDVGYPERNGINIARLPWSIFNVKDDAVWKVAREGRFDEARIFHTHSMQRMFDELPFDATYIEYVLKAEKKADELARAAHDAKQRGDRAMAFSFAQAAIDAFVANGHHRVILADLLVEQGRIDLALDLLRAVVKLERAHLGFEGKLAWLLLQNGRHEEAVAAARRCLEWDGGYEPARKVLDEATAAIAAGRK